ncbi:MAG: long-chain fatty acid--CoA ligase, partial [Chitinophagales bacterium]
MGTEGALRLLSDYMKKGAQDYPDKPAFIFREQRVSYREFAEKTERFARYLLKMGVQKGDRIAYIFIPRPEFFYLYMAASRIGAIIVGMSTRYTANEMEFILKNSEASYIVTMATMYDIDYQERLGQILPNCPLVKHIAVVEGAPVLENAVSFEEIINDEYSEYVGALEKREAEISTHDGLIIVYTSGSTGQPKGALMSHQNIIHMSLVEISQCEAVPEDIWLNHLPVNHVSGATEVGATSIVANSTQILEPFNPVRVLEIIQKERVTILGQVPTMYAMEFAQPDYDKYDLSSVRIVLISGAMAPMELLTKMVNTICP